MAEKRESRARRNRGTRGGLRRFHDVENVIVEEPFTLTQPTADSGPAGDGCYVTATVHNRRYYGVLVDQEALKAASGLWFKDEASSLDLNRRMNQLQQQQQQQQQKQQEQKQSTKVSDSSLIQSNVAEAKNNGDDNNNNDNKRPANTDLNDTATKRQKDDHNMNDNIPDPSLSSDSLISNSAVALASASSATTTKSSSSSSSSNTATNNNSNNTQLMPIDVDERPVQKFRYVETKPMPGAAALPGYRVLLATFANVNVAADDDPIKAEQIQKACQDGGNFVGPYYYQYEVLATTLNAAHQVERKVKDGMRTSMGFHTFLSNTVLPSWFPLANLQLGQHKVLSMLQMKRDNNGNVVWDKDAEAEANKNSKISLHHHGTHIPMKPRQRFKIGVIGGGIAGLACCQELLRLLDEQSIDVELTLFEARSRLGGRLWTDTTTFKDDHGKSFAVDLGASWIHGIDDNPLAALAKQANVDFCRTSEEVQMFDEGMRPVDKDIDEEMGKVFDSILDLAADDIWARPDIAPPDQRNQKAIRWYSSVFMKNQKDNDNDVTRKSNKNKNNVVINATDAPPHRHSSDRSIDCEIGYAIANHKLREFAKFSKEERRMLLWNTKNVEYALGANITDLSMKFWDSDERHAFEGDHVLLKQGYSSVISYMQNQLKQKGKNFKLFLDFPVGKVEFNRKSTTKAYLDTSGRNRRLVELSDTCSVSSQDGKSTHYFDFLVCAVPLGVLKESVARAGDIESTDKLSFYPSLPFSKIDAITNVGFGLLDKVYLQFSIPFWRRPGVFDEDQSLFGNATGLHPHHYMFFDVGKSLRGGTEPPAVLMSLVSGKEAVMCEHLSDQEIIKEVMETLRCIFSVVLVPNPSAFHITRWGQDQYARGSYTFLPAGATDQDFQILQTPINGNGDSLMLEGSETMRLFFAGEHTTALHPSMAHGAMLSGIRAAKEVASTIQFTGSEDKTLDRLIPLALFRHKNPDTACVCSLCHKVGGQLREGALLAFKRGARQALVHNNCAEYSPEVEVMDSKWRHVIKAVNRSRSLNCSTCGKNGATIGCTHEQCFRVFHFCCSEDTGWRFDVDGKIYYCELHRSLSSDINRCDRISMEFFLSKNPRYAQVCQLCKTTQAPNVGELLAFQSGRRQVCLHQKCIKYTNIVDTTAMEESRLPHEHKNVFRAVQLSKSCTLCKKDGATIQCISRNCTVCYHLTCARQSGWNFEKRGAQYRCKAHRVKQQSKLTNKAQSTGNESNSNPNGSSNGALQHNLLARFGVVLTPDMRIEIPSNLDMGGTKAPKSGNGKGNDDVGSSSSVSGFELSSSDSEEDSFIDGEDINDKVLDMPLSIDVRGPKRLVRVRRKSRDHPWELVVKVVRISQHKKVLSVAKSTSSAATGNVVVKDGLQSGDVIISLGGVKVGTEPLKSLRLILSRLKQEIDLKVEIVRGSPDFVLSK